MQLALTRATGGASGITRSARAEMVSLADEQIRFEATAKLLTGAYEKLRLSIRGR